MSACDLLIYMWVDVQLPNLSCAREYCTTEHLKLGSNNGVQCRDLPFGWRFYSLTLFLYVLYDLVMDYNMGLSTTLAKTALPQYRIEASYFVQTLMVSKSTSLT